MDGNTSIVHGGGHGVVVSGCPACKEQFQSLNQFVTHLSEDVVPVTIRRALFRPGVPTEKSIRACLLMSKFPLTSERPGFGRGQLVTVVVRHKRTTSARLASNRTVQAAIRSWRWCQAADQVFESCVSDT
jgi:hypothetical protein